MLNALPFNDYTPPAGPGQPYQFHRPDGPSLAFTGQQADQLASYIDRQRADRPLMADNSMLNPDGSLREPGQAPAGAAPSRQDAMVAKARADMATNAAAAEAARSGGPTWDQIGQFDAKGNRIGPAPQAASAPMGPPPAPAAAAAPPPPAKDYRPPPGRRVVLGGTPPPPEHASALPELPGGTGAPDAAPRPGLAPMDTVHDPGRNPAREDAMAVPVRQEVTTKTTGGVHSPEDRAALQGLYGHEQAAAEAESQARIASSLAESNAALASANEMKLRAQQYQDEVDAAQAKKAAIDAAFQKKQDVVNQEIEQAQGQGVDPHRIFRGKPGNQILAALSIGLSEFGSKLSGGPNTALQIIDRKIDQDIEEQRQQIATGRADRQNRLAELQKQHGLTSSDAEAAYRIAINNQLSNQSGIVAAGMKSNEAMLQAQAFQAQMAEKNRKLFEQMYHATAGEETERTERSKYIAPRAAGDRKATLKERAEAAKYQAEIAKSEYEVGHEGSAPPKAAGAGPAKLTGRLGATEAINESAQEDLEAYKKITGWIPDLPGDAIETAARRDLDALVDVIAPKIMAGNGEPMTEGGLAHLKAQMRAANPNIREAIARRGTGASKTVHRAIERQRGGVQESGSSSDEGDR